MSKEENKDLKEKLLSDEQQDAAKGGDEPGLQTSKKDAKSGKEQENIS